MAFKDYENLDVTKETASEEELERLRKEYGVEKQYNYKAGVRRTLTCLGIAIILTVVTMLLYSNILVDFIAKMSFSMLYFISFFAIVSEIYAILLKRINIKEDVFILILMLDLLICLTACIIGIFAPVSITLKTIALIITGITFTSIIILAVVAKILGI